MKALLNISADLCKMYGNIAGIADYIQLISVSQERMVRNDWVVTLLQMAFLGF
jgi:hypothetical protein